MTFVEVLPFLEKGHAVYRYGWNARKEEYINKGSIFCFLIRETVTTESKAGSIKKYIYSLYKKEGLRYEFVFNRRFEPNFDIEDLLKDEWGLWDDYEKEILSKVSI